MNKDSAYSTYFKPKCLYVGISSPSIGLQAARLDFMR